MRWAIGFLVVINIVIFLWGNLIQAPMSARSERPATSGISSLDLLPDGTSNLDTTDVADPVRAPNQATSKPDPAAAAMRVETADSRGSLETVAGDDTPPRRGEASPQTSAHTAGLSSQERRIGPSIAADDPEANRAGDGRQDGLVAEHKEPEGGRYCGRTGPIKDRKRAKAANQRLEEAGLRSLLQEVVEPTDKGYWVLIPPLADQAEGERMVAKLRDKGVKDMWLFTRGELSNAISLGLYNRRKNAEIRRQQLEALGFEVEVRPRVEPKLHYQLSFSGRDSGLVDRVRRLLPRQASRPMPCDQMAAQSDPGN